MIQLYPLPQFLSKSPKDDPISRPVEKSGTTPHGPSDQLRPLASNSALRTSMPDGTRGSPARLIQRPLRTGVQWQPL